MSPCARLTERLVDGASSISAPSQRELMLAGQLYVAEDPELARDSLRAMTLTEQLNSTPAGDAQKRLSILKELLGAIGKGSESDRRFTATTVVKFTSAPGPS